MRIEGSVVVVTGAGSGIGAALAHAFAAAGARVVVGDIDGDRADTTATHIIERGHTAVALRADASNDADIDAMIELAAIEFGPVDVYVAQRLTAIAITHAAEVVEPEQVADTTVDAVRNDTFLVLPHPQVLDLLREKNSDYGHWISGMKRYPRSLPTNLTLKEK